ncbi:MAG: DUF2232 domain-containing protein [Gammaproteobacteria bacterium]
MRALASFILRGYVQAVIITAVTAVLSLMLPPLSHISGAAVGLCTLRNGIRQGIGVMAGGAVILALVGYFSNVAQGMTLILILAMVLVWWGPAAIAATILRSYRSFGVVLMVLGGISAFAIAVVYMVFDDVSGWWQQILSTMMGPLLESASLPVAKGDIQQLIVSLSNIMTGFVAATMVLSAMINTFIARWWQAMLFNPGGFREEFLALKLSRRAALLSLIIIISSAFVSGNVAHYIQNLLIVILVIFALQGLSLLHVVVFARKIGGGWLAAVYLPMLFFLPQVILTLAVLGLADSVFEIRDRVKKRGESTDSGSN